MDWLPDIPMSYSPTITLEFRVDQIQFGDGYVQRQAKGINSVTESWECVWTNLDQGCYRKLYDFLVSRIGVYAFWWQAPWDGYAKRWVCTQMSGPRPSEYQSANINATFVEDHNP